jgi:hypothetical protein
MVDWLRDYDEVRDAAYADFGRIDKELGPEYSREEFAERALKFENSDLLFRLLDGRSIDEDCWKLVCPTYDWSQHGE